jgi:multidrug efflux pump subunit AcrB
VVRFLIDRPIAVITLVIVAAILGIISGFRMPVSLLPDIDIPEVSIRISSTDMAAQHLEDEFVTPLRISLQQIRGFQNIKSETTNSESIISLRFKYGTDISLATIEVNEKIDELSGRYLGNIERPTVYRKTSSDIPVFYLNINYDTTVRKFEPDLLELSNYVRNVVKRRTEQAREVSLVDISGLIKGVVQIIPDDGKLRSLEITYNDLEA